MLTRQRHILERLLPQESSDPAVFVRDEKGEPFLSIELRYDDWNDMGKPDEITVTIEPGNTIEETK